MTFGGYGTAFYGQSYRGPCFDSDFISLELHVIPLQKMQQVVNLSLLTEWSSLHDRSETIFQLSTALCFTFVNLAIPQ